MQIRDIFALKRRHRGLNSVPTLFHQAASQHCTPATADMLTAWRAVRYRAFVVNCVPLAYNRRRTHDSAVAQLNLQFAWQLVWLASMPRTTPQAHAINRAVRFTTTGLVVKHMVLLIGIAGIYIRSVGSFR